jgi:signal transduction histidine kinase
MRIDDRRRAMNGIELAVRRVSDRLKGRVPWDMGLTAALDELADEIAEISSGSDAALSPSQPHASEKTGDGQ